ncbi:MAG TPA: hypothetical protein VFT22_12120 [Kofleriaceae bacterium]|nr:hypothetical protein [Kofleriaceae bacterium]
MTLTTIAAPTRTTSSIAMSDLDDGAIDAQRGSATVHDLVDPVV